MIFHYLSHFTFQKLILILNTFIIIAESVKIEKMLIPEVVQSGKSNAAILDCIYSGASDQISVQWIFSDHDPPVYEWSPRSEPRVRGVLDGRLDLSYRPSGLLTERRGALRIVNLDPELSGNYTCRIVDQATEARQTKYMLVFSPEKDLEVEFYRKGQDIEIKCRAQGLSPQPEMTLEYNGVTFPKQQFRVWRSEEGLYDAENSALLSVASFGMARPDRPQRITCRLLIPAAGYTAIKNEFLIGHQCCNSRSSKASMLTLRLHLLISFTIKAIVMLIKTE